MNESRSSGLLPRVFVVGVLLAWAGVAHAQAVVGKSLGSSAKQGEEAVASSVAVAASEFTAAVHRWAHVKATEVPWNEPNSTTPINYRPVFLWASGSTAGYAGSASDCQFPAAGGAAVPGVSGPIKISGQSFTINTSSSQQAQAVRTALMNAGSLRSDGSYRLLPDNFGATWDGVFCASVKFNAPAPKRVQVATWFAPSRLANTPGNRSTTTNDALILEIGRKMAARASATQKEVAVAAQSGARVTIHR